MNRKQPQTFFAQPYDQAGWLKTIHDTFPRTEVFSQPQAVPVGDSRAKSVLQLGSTRLAVHGLEGDIRQAITYYEDLHQSIGHVGFVMVNGKHTG
jgi:hypothetical protein